MNKSKAFGLIMVLCSYSAFISTFNETLLNVAFSPIMAEFSVGVSTVQWLATAYMLGAAVMIPIAAFAFRWVNTRVLFCGATAVMVAGWVVGAFAGSFPVLLVARIVQALGTGLLIPTTMNIVVELSPRETLGANMGIMAGLCTVGVSVSIVASGLVLSFATWHALMWLFAVLSLIAFLGGAVLLGDNAPLTHPRLDAPSVALVALALIGVLYGISTLFSGDVVMALLSIVLGVVLFVVFAKRQLSLEQPLVNIRVFAERSFRFGIACNLLALVCTFALNIIIPMYMQSVLGYSATFAAVSLLPAALANCAVATVSGRVYDKHGARPLLIPGFLLVVVFSVALSLNIATDAPWLRTLLFAPIPIAAGLIVGPSQTFALSRLHGPDNPDGVVVMSTGFQVAGCFGSSVFAGIYSATAVAELNTGMAVTAAYTTGFMAAGALACLCGLIGIFCAWNVLRMERQACQESGARQCAAHGM